MYFGLHHAFYNLLSMFLAFLLLYGLVFNSFKKTIQGFSSMAGKMCFIRYFRLLKNHIFFILRKFSKITHCPFIGNLALLLFVYLWDFYVCVWKAESSHAFKWHIYLSLNQIWAQSEKGEIASERHSWCHVSLISGLLADFGWTPTQVREGL